MKPINLFNKEGNETSPLPEFIYLFFTEIKIAGFSRNYSSDIFLSCAMNTYVHIPAKMLECTCTHTDGNLEYRFYHPTNDSFMYKTFKDS